MTRGSTYRLNDVDGVALAGRIGELKSIISALVPGALVEHVGATSVAGLPTKGNLDVQVRVPREHFTQAQAALQQAFRPTTPALPRNDGTSFVADHETVPAGIHLTVIDGDADEGWVFRELLREDATLRASLGQLRRAYDGRPDDDWRAAKTTMFETLRQDPRFLRTRALAHFPVRVDLTVQWGEMDDFGHVNNVVYFRWFETSRVGLFARLSLDRDLGVGGILASTSCRYKAPLYCGDVVTTAARVQSVADDRFVVEHALWSRDLGRVAAVGEASVVAYDYETKKKSRLPEDFGARVERLWG